MQRSRYRPNKLSNVTIIQMLPRIISRIIQIPVLLDAMRVHLRTWHRDVHPIGGHPRARHPRPHHSRPQRHHGTWGYHPHHHLRGEIGHRHRHTTWEQGGGPHGHAAETNPRGAQAHRGAGGAVLELLALGEFLTKVKRGG